MWLWAACIIGLCISEATSSGPRSAFVQRLEPREFSAEFFVPTGPSGGDVRQGPAMIEDLRRGHEGLMVKLNDVSRSLKEDELKLNNIFYKLGRHDTDLEGVDSTITRLSTSTRRLESKLNKHAFNVDFLRRRVEELKSGAEAEQRVEVQIAAARTLINRLEDRLTDALARLGNVENTTQTLEKRSVPHYGDFHGPTMELHSRPPTLAVYPDRYAGLSASTGDCRVDWEQVGTGCYWFGGEELTFSEAIANCISHGGFLLTLSPPGNQLNLLLNRLRSGTVYWTSGTDAFNNGNWEFLVTATPVMPLHWAVEVNGTSYPNHHCAGLTTSGLIKRRCTHRLPYICHII